jgi:energy-coupling factor transporter ATP-binding protein EcfA2
MERLEVRFFGPIKDAVLDIKEVNILIGPSSSGKSVLAKLLLIVKDYEQIKKVKTIQAVKEVFNRYGIGSLLIAQTYIKYESDNHTFIISKNTVRGIRKKSALLKAYNSLVSSSEVLGEIDYDYLDRYIKDNVFDSVKTLVAPLYKELGDLPYQIYHELVRIVHLSGDISSQIEDSYNIIEDDDEFAENLYSDVERLITYAVTFSRKTVPQLRSIQKTLYIPAERILFSLISENYFTLESSNTSLPKTLVDFGVVMEKARQGNQVYKIDFMKLAYQFRDNKNVISHGDTRFNLADAASGIQALVPLCLAIDFTNRVSGTSNNHFIIEEPELNLYPSQQKKLTEYLIKSCSYNNNSLTITTHSPYVLTSLNNLIQAYNAYSAFPNKENQISDIVKKEFWLKFSRISAYYMNDGYAQNILDYEMKSIGAIHIDDVSEQIGEEFNSLTDIIYG